jgi:hypothetical protein
MSLPKFWAIGVVNNSGQTVTFNSNGRFDLNVQAIHFNSSAGKLVYTEVLAADDLDFDAGRSVVNGTGVMDDASKLQTAEQDNTSNLYVGLQVSLKVTHDAGTAADGTFDLYLLSGDTTGALESNASGFDDFDDGNCRRIGSLIWHNLGVDDEIMQSKTFVIGI